MSLLRFVKTRYGYFSRTIRNTNSLVPVSHLHIHSEAQYAANRNSGFDVGGVRKGRDESRVGISHPWSEWVDLMELLLNKGYFGTDGNPFGIDRLGPKESNRIRTACLNFARDGFGIIRLLSSNDIRVISEWGCPSLDRKVVNSGKRLRAHVGVEEGNVCASCNLRGNCQRADMAAREDEGARTVDVMRILLTYGIDHIISSVENKSLCQNECVKESVRNLLREMVVYGLKDTESDLLNARTQNEQPSASQKADDIEASDKLGDWRCPKCNFLNFARNIRCLRCDALYEERLRLLREEEQDHLPLKRGDWICEICNFMNFAKNTRCLRCREKPPTRQLNPGEWECESCNYINFRRNMVCLKCDHKRTTASKAVQADAKPKNENNGNTHNEKFKLSCSKKEPRFGKTRGSTNMWRFVDEETENRHEPVSKNDDCGFMDFPIEGGKSGLSQSRAKREKEMLEKRNSNGGTRDDDDDEKRRLELLGSTYDEEMDDWFGQR